MLELCGYLTTLFLGKPPRGSLPVYSALSFASNWQLALVEPGKGENLFPHKNVPDPRFDLKTTCVRSRHATDQLLCPVKLPYLFLGVEQFGLGKRCRPR